MNNRIMKNKKIILIIAGAALAAFILGFFRDAAFPKAMMDNEEIYQHRDRLTGVFMTKEPLSSSASGKEPEAENILVPSIPDHYYVDYNPFNYDPLNPQDGEKIYAVLKDCTRTDDNGNEETYQDYRFEGIEGIPFYLVKIGEEQKNVQQAYGEENVVSDVKMHIFSDENEEDSVALSGTLRMVPEDKDTIFYLNPVYQQEDGAVYMVPGEGLAVGASLESASEISTKLTETYTQTIMVKTAVQHTTENTQENSVEIAFEKVMIPEKIAVLQFDEENKLIASEEILPGNLPESVKKEKQASWMCVETVCRDSAGKEQVTRELVPQEYEFFRIYTIREDNIAVPQLISVIR